MSIDIMSKVWRIDGLTQAQKLVLLSLADNANDSGICWPSIGAIARRCCMAERSITRTIGELESFGYVTREHRSGKQTRYLVTPDQKSPLTKSHPDPKAPRQDAQNTPDGKSPPPDGRSSLPNNPNKDITTNSHQEEPSTRAGAKTYPEEFLEIWNIWPDHRRCAKPKAYAAWLHACRSAHPSELLAAVKRYLLTEEARNKFTPYPAKWFEDERWLDFEGSPSQSPVMPTIIELGGDTDENRQFLRIMENLRHQLGEPVFRSWLKQLRVVHKNCTVLSLSAKSRFNSEYLKSHFEDDILRAVGTVWPEITQLNITARVLQ